MEELPAGAKGSGRPEDGPVASPFLVSPEDEPSPSLAAAAGRPRRGPSRLPVGLGALAAAVVVIGLVLWGLAPRGEPVTQATFGEQGSVLAPIQPRADVGSGEQVAPFSGFAISIDTDPAGALVSIAGVPRGEAPVLANLDCEPGGRIEIEAQKKGFSVARTSTTCRRDALVKLTVRLPR